MILPFELHYGIVEDNDDPEQKGRMQVRLLPEMESVARQQLPWLMPFEGGKGIKAGTYEKDLMEVGTPVWCFFKSATFRTGWYIGGFFLENSFDFSRVSSELGSAADIDLGEYKDITFSRFKDGSIEFRNHKNGVSGHYHNSGSYVIFSSTGDIIAYSKTSIKLYNDNSSIELKEAPGDIEVNSNGNIIFNGSGDNLVTYNDLYQILTQLVANLDSRIYVDPLSGYTGTVNPTHIQVTFDPTHLTKMTNMKADKVFSE